MKEIASEFPGPLTGMTYYEGCFYVSVENKTEQEEVEPLRKYCEGPFR
ncbi:hypothetical protein ACOI1C_20470 [Bacillus sp. DJP31]